MRLAILQANHLVLDASGQPVQFSFSDLDEIVSSYNPATNPAPVVVGHPKSNSPAHGWWERLERSGDYLFAMVSDNKLSQPFRTALKKGCFRKWSASIFRRESTANPVPGKLSLRHVGFLGANAPAFGNLFSHPDNQIDFAAVPADQLFQFEQIMDLNSLKDLETIALSDIAAALGIEESALEALMQEPEAEPEMPADFAERQAAQRRKEIELAARERELDAKEFASFCDSLVTAGKPLPAVKDDLVAFMLSLRGGEPLSFAEGKQEDRLEWFKELLNNLPQQVDFGEVAGGSLPINPRQADPQKTAKAIQEAQAKGLDFIEATKSVLEGE